MSDQMVMVVLEEKHYSIYEYIDSLEYLKYKQSDREYEAR